MVAFFAVLLAGCAVKGEPIEFSKACAVENDGKNVQITGVLSPRSSTFCSNRGGRMECPFDLVEAAGSEKTIGADIEVGSGANTVDEIPKGYKKEDLKVRDNGGNCDGETERFTGREGVLYAGLQDRTVTVYEPLRLGNKRPEHSLPRH